MLAVSVIFSLVMFVSFKEISTGAIASSSWILLSYLIF